MKKILECCELKKVYSSNRKHETILDNINLTFYKGDFTVVMGDSGSGKSTLIHCLSSMDEPTEGDIKFKGKKIIELTDKEKSVFRNKNIGFVFQDINLIDNFNVLENIVLPGLIYGKQMKIVKSSAEELLKKVGLREKLFKYPKELSGGQQQRVAICRALINNPEILFADEPTGALNHRSGKDILDILTETNASGQSIIMVTHDLKAALRANRLIYLFDGEVKGELILTKYLIGNKNDREHKITNWLKEMDW